MQVPGDFGGEWQQVPNRRVLSIKPDAGQATLRVFHHVSYIFSPFHRTPLALESRHGRG